MASRYGKTARNKVKRAMHERKTGSLRSGSTGRKVKSRKQAIAIGLSEARREGGKVPAPRRRKTAAKKKSARRTTRRRASTGGKRSTSRARG